MFRFRYLFYLLKYRLKFITWLSKIRGYENILELSIESDNLYSL
jgi:hypothetical protein